MTVRIGTSGWTYPDWQPVLYPPGLSQREWLDVYARHFTTVELNASFYHWPRQASFDGWQRRLPEGFIMSVKAPRQLTHVQRLGESGEWLERIQQDLSRLEDKQGPLLVQLPASFSYDLPRLAGFLEEVPSGLRLAFEFRHPGWHREETFQLLEKHQAAYCVMSGPGLPCILRATASFVYLRLHGPDPYPMYVGAYSEQDLRWWAGRIAEWQAQGRQVYAYFNNTTAGNAVRNAQSLNQMLQE